MHDEGADKENVAANLLNYLEISNVAANLWHYHYDHHGYHWCHSSDYYYHA